MATPLEGVVRPFADADVTPTKFTRPGAASVPMVHVKVGFTGSVKTASWSVSTTITTKMGQKHVEKAPTWSDSLKQTLNQIAQGVSGG
jgi:hypothetical protein